MSLLYSEIRDSLKTGDLVSWDKARVNSIFGFILKLYQKILRPKSVHVGIVANIGGRIFVVEARPPCVRLYPLSLLENFYLVRTNVKEENTNLDFLFKEIGIPYKAWDVIKGVIFHADNDTKAIYCSELAKLYYVEIKYLDKDKYEDSGSSPDSILNAICEVSGNKPVYVEIDRSNLNAV